MVSLWHEHASLLHLRMHRSTVLFRSLFPAELWNTFVFAFLLSPLFALGVALSFQSFL